MPTIKLREKHRSDKGLVLATPRDNRIITFIAHQTVCRYDHIKVLLDREPGGPTKVAEGGLQDSTVKDQIDRWRRAGWIEYSRVLANEKGYAYVTKTGLRFFGLDDLYKEARPPSQLRYHHYWAVADVCLYWWSGTDPEYRGEWISERRLRAEVVGAKLDPDHVFAPIRALSGSIPDAVVFGDDFTDAIEVQLSPLKPVEMQKKLLKICHARYLDLSDNEQYVYDQIHVYVPNKAMKEHIERARKHLDADDQGRIEIYVDASYETFRSFNVD